MPKEHTNKFADNQFSEKRKKKDYASIFNVKRTIAGTIVLSGNWMQEPKATRISIVERCARFGCKKAEKFESEQNLRYESLVLNKIVPHHGERGEF